MRTHYMQEAYKGEIQCPSDQIKYASETIITIFQLLLLSSNQNTVFHRK